MRANKTPADYKAIESESRSRNEHNDCAVRAVAIVTGLPYSQVHKVFADNGRKYRKGTPRDVTWKAIDALGYDCEPVRVTAKTGVTLDRDRALQSGRFVVGMTRHLAAVVDGSVIDWTAGRRKQVRDAYRITKKPGLDIDYIEPTPAAPMRRIPQMYTQRRLF